MKLAEGEKTYIKKFRREYVDLMQNWGRHREPLFYCYNFPYMSKTQMDYWYRSRTSWFSKKCFAVFNYHNRLVGYIALRNIKIFRRTGELGIVFDPNNIDRGYGTDGLKAFLEYYFETLKMRTLYLKVSVFNKRAQKCYRKAGFKFFDIVMDEFEDQSLPVFQDDRFIPYRHLFKQENKKLKCQFIDMIITKKMFYRQKSLPH